VHHDDIDAAAASTFNAKGPLFYHYAALLQNSVREPLDMAFAPGESNHCPECFPYVAVEQGWAWKIVKEIVHKVLSMPECIEEQIKKRTYLLSN
jgi:hypothetical protein